MKIHSCFCPCGIRKYSVVTFFQLFICTYLLNQHNAYNFVETRLEGWLSVPNKQNIRRFGWNRQYLVVSSKKIIFYASEQHKVQNEPQRVLDIE